VVDPAGAAAHFGLGSPGWEKLCLWGMIFYYLTAPARYDAAARRAKQAALTRASVRIAAGEPPGSVDLPSIGVQEAIPDLPCATA
jgi:hypothetical protein